MNWLGPSTVLAGFILFCRIGACLMLMPGFSSPRVPVSVRLFICFAITAALVPLLAPDIVKLLKDDAPFDVLRLIVSELLIGGLIGFMGRIFFAALETLGTGMAMFTGLSNALGAPINEDEPLPSLAALLTFLATTLLFVTDLHWEVLRGLVASYRTIPAAVEFAPRSGLVQVADCLSRAFFLALRIASPFIMFSVIVNLAIGFANRLTPQIQVYFISMPFVVAGGLVLLYFTYRQLLVIFLAGFSTWLHNG
ncbi:MAG: flagellar biosynthesis protein FliR [Beijerinckiaceae bacterium]